jgi:hypothetical protein
LNVAVADGDFERAASDALDGQDLTEMIGGLFQERHYVEWIFAHRA